METDNRQAIVRPIIQAAVLICVFYDKLRKKVRSAQVHVYADGGYHIQKE